MLEICTSPTSYLFHYKCILLVFATGGNLKTEPISIKAFNLTRIPSLGHGLNLHDYGSKPSDVLALNFTNPAVKAYLNDAVTKDIENGPSDNVTKFTIVKGESTDYREFTADLNVDASIGPWLDFTFKLTNHRLNSLKRTSESIMFYLQVVTTRDELNIQGITPDMFNLEEGAYPTHVCTQVKRGKNLTGHITITTKENISKTENELESDVRAAFLFVKAGAGGGTKTNYDRITKEYNVKAEFRSESITAPLPIVTSFEGLNSLFLTYIDGKEDGFVKSGDVEYIFTPIILIRDFAKIDNLFPGAELASEYLERVRTIDVDMMLMFEALDSLTIATESKKPVPADVEIAKDHVVSFLFETVVPQRRQMKEFFWVDGFKGGNTTHDYDTLITGYKSISTIKILGSSQSSFEERMEVYDAVNKLKEYLGKDEVKPEPPRNRTIIHGHSYSLQGVLTDRYLKLNGNRMRENELVSGFTQLDSGTTFKIVNASTTGYFNLAVNNLYLHLRKKVFVSRKPSRDGAGDFTIIESKIKEGEFSFQSRANARYLQIERNGRVSIGWDNHIHQRFFVEEVLS